MDVHAPHEPIHGVKGFLLHLLTITVGLLIAVGIEGCVELHREHKLVREARETLREEIKSNSETMNGAVANLEKEDKAIANNIDILTKLMRSPKDQPGKGVNISADFSMVGLKDTAWKTAQTTGALTYMSYADAQRYASVYRDQQSFFDMQDKILDDEAQFVGVMRKLDFGHGDVTEGTGERFSGAVWDLAGSSFLSGLAAKVTAANDEAFLQGKEGRKHMHYDLHWWVATISGVAFVLMERGCVVEAKAKYRDPSPFGCAKAVFGMCGEGDVMGLVGAEGLY